MEAGDGRDLLELLPPLPVPDRRRMRQEACGGCALVLTIVAGCLGATHAGTAYMEGWVQAETIVALKALVYVEALVALVCLLGLLWGDPGVVRRSEQTCLPMPEEVASKLRSGQPLEAMENIVRDGQTFCARCLMWRGSQRPGRRRGVLESLECFDSSDRRFHHCSTCQRCVEHFDHHCGVFGRCIAGRGFGGNLGYFKVIIGTGYLGGMSAAAILCIGMIHAGDVGYWVAVLFGSYVALMLTGTICTVVVWQLRMLVRRTPSIWEWELFRRPATGERSGFTRVEAGGGSDLDVSPVDAVIIGARR